MYHKTPINHKNVNYPQKKHNISKIGLLGYVLFLFLKTILRTVFENTTNTFLVLFENCSCSLNSVFFVLFMFFRTKKIKTKRVLSVFFVYENKKLFSKIATKLGLARGR